MVESDKSKGVHNPAFVNSALDVSIFAVNSINAAAISPRQRHESRSDRRWTRQRSRRRLLQDEVRLLERDGRPHARQRGSQWRTDLVARNLESSTASLRFVLHQASGDLEAAGTVDGNSQKAFEDLTATMSARNIGALEICSDRPLLVATRIFNQAENGTTARATTAAWPTSATPRARPSALSACARRPTRSVRLVVTNGGETEATVTINLFDSSGKSLTAYSLTVKAGTGLQDIEPFKNRANAPDVDWGFATVTVVKGTNIISSASMIDMKTNDPTTIQAKQ